MRWRTLGAAAAAVGVVVLGHAGCESSSDMLAGSGTGGTSVGSGEGGTLFSGTANGGSGGANTPCVNLECQQVDCPGAVTTTVSGTIYDPSGTLPLYNVGVYIPNAPLDPVPSGLDCNQCDATFSGSPLVSALTDTHGKFTLENVPVGADIPMVIQVGKWRREVKIDSVAQCVDNPMNDPQVTRLPKGMSEGNIPKIALTTGSADPFFCLLRRLGIDDMEYGIAGSTAQIHFYQGFNGSTQFDSGFGASPGATFPLAQNTLWNTDWANYDIVMLSCEGNEYPAPKTGHRVSLRDYINVGGRVFATHYHYNWFQADAPADLQSVAQFQTIQTSFDDFVDIDQTFPKGVALAEWMDFVNNMVSPFGTFMVHEGRQHTLNVDQTLARIWVRHQSTTEYFSFNAPIGAPEDQQCGRMIHTDIHVSAGAGNPDGPFPSTCNNGPLTEQERALIFMFFDLAACITPDEDQPCPPGQASCGDAGDPVCSGTCVNGCCEPIIE